MNLNSPLLSERKLWDSLGNYCRVSMYVIGQNLFEIYFHAFNETIPVRYVGSLGDCNTRVDLWLNLKKQEGFIEQLPSYTPTPIN